MPIYVRTKYEYVLRGVHVEYEVFAPQKLSRINMYPQQRRGFSFVEWQLEDKVA